MDIQEKIQEKINGIKKDENNFFLGYGGTEDYIWCQFVKDLKEQIQLTEITIYKDERSETEKSIIFSKAQIIMILNWIEKLGKNWVVELDKDLWLL